MANPPSQNEASSVAPKVTTGERAVANKACAASTSSKEGPNVSHDFDSIHIGIDWGHSSSRQETETFVSQAPPQQQGVVSYKEEEEEGEGEWRARFVDHYRELYQSYYSARRQQQPHHMHTEYSYCYPIDSKRSDGVVDSEQLRNSFRSSSTSSDDGIHETQPSNEDDHDKNDHSWYGYRGTASATTATHGAMATAVATTADSTELSQRQTNKLAVPRRRQRPRHQRTPSAIVREASTRTSTAASPTSPRRRPLDPLPKRPLNAYNFFFRDYRIQLMKDRQGNAVPFAALGKQVGKKWQSLAPEEKEFWEMRAEQDSKRYQREKEQYERQLQKRRKRESSVAGAPDLFKANKASRNNVESVEERNAQASPKSRSSASPEGNEDDSTPPRIAWLSRHPQAQHQQAEDEESSATGTPSSRFTDKEILHLPTHLPPSGTQVMWPDKRTGRIRLHTLLWNVYRMPESEIHGFVNNLSEESTPRLQSMEKVEYLGEEPSFWQNNRHNFYHQYNNPRHHHGMGHQHPDFVPTMSTKQQPTATIPPSYTKIGTGGPPPAREVAQWHYPYEHSRNSRDRHSVW